MADGVRKEVCPKFKGAPNNFCYIGFLIRALLEPPVKSKMAARVPQNGRLDLERSVFLDY